MLKKMESAKKKAETVVNTVDIGEREKMAQLKRYKCHFTPSKPLRLHVPQPFTLLNLWQ